MVLASGENGGVAWICFVTCDMTRVDRSGEWRGGKGDILPLFNLLHPAVGRVVHHSYVNIER